MKSTFAKLALLSLILLPLAHAEDSINDSDLSTLREQAARVQAAASDELLSTHHDNKTESCTAYGNCYMYDYNSSTSRYEYYTGYHSSCKGERRKDVTTKKYKRPDGSTYEQTDEGYWSSCNINFNSL